MENTLKIKVFRKSILFCKYLRNGSSDLYEIFFVVVYYYLVSLSLEFHEDPDSNARAQVVIARTRDKTCARAFTTRLCTDLHRICLEVKREHWIEAAHPKLFYVVVCGSHKDLKIS